MLDKIQPLKIPLKYQEQVEMQTIAARSRPYSDPEELLPMCYRCSTYNPLSATSNRCINCGQKFVHSYVSFGNIHYFLLLTHPRFAFLIWNLFVEILPLVEFQLEEGISDLEAVRLIETPPNEKIRNAKQEISESHQTLQLDLIEEVDDNDDPFTAKLIHFDVRNLPQVLFF